MPSRDSQRLNREGSPVPFGYSVGDDGLLVTVPGEADLVVRCYELYASGTTTAGS